MPSTQAGRTLSGADKAAIFLLALGEARSIRLLEQMEEHEVRAIAARTATLGTVDARLVERLFREFGSRATVSAAPPRPVPPRVAVQAAEPRPALGPAKAAKDPAPASLWERMRDVPDPVLAQVLGKEHPQTAAVILSKIDSRQASRVLKHCAKDFAGDVIMRMARLGAVNPVILGAIEQTLGAELTSAMNERPKTNPASPGVELLEAGADAIRALILTGEKDKLLSVLKTASHDVRDRVFNAFPARARALLMEDLADLTSAAGDDAPANEVLVPAAAERRSVIGDTWPRMRTRP